MSEEKKTETPKQAADLIRDNYSKALESATKLQEQYFENVKKATDYLLELQKAWIDAASKAAPVSPEMLRGGVTSEAYRSVYNFWMKQFETLSRLVGMPMMPPIRGSIESAGDITESFSKGFEIYSKSYATWIELTKKNIEIASQNIADMQKVMLETYKGMVPLFSVPEEERAKIFDWITESIKKSLETTTAVVNKQLETLAKLIADLSSNIEKLASAMKPGSAPAT
jgi:uncharacterized protein YukE